MNPAPLLPPPPSGACVLEVRAVRKGHQTGEVGVVALHALDVTTGITVLEAIERINRDLGTLTVIITHNAVMAEMADRVLFLSDGKIVKERRNESRRPASGLEW